jgi:hypothetical protein
LAREDAVRRVVRRLRVGAASGGRRVAGAAAVLAVGFSRVDCDEGALMQVFTGGIGQGKGQAHCCGDFGRLGAGGREVKRRELDAVREGSVEVKVVAAATSKGEIDQFDTDIWSVLPLDGH